MSEPMQCPRRREGVPAGAPDHDHWLVREKGRRTCSYCGSLHPDDFMELVRAGVEIGPTDKSYKMYVEGPEAGRIGKFYTQHLSPVQGREFWNLTVERRVTFGYPGYLYTPIYLPGASEDARS